MKASGPLRLLRSATVPVIGAVLVTYFGYHTIHGQRGILARAEIAEAIAAAEVELSALRVERETLERRAALLDPDHVDLDMLDEQARRMLNYATADEVVLFLPTEERP